MNAFGGIIINSSLYGRKCIHTGHFKGKDADMTRGAVWKELLRFSIPMALGLLFQQLYNTVDTIVVGQYVGKAALAAVGSTSSIINTLVGFCTGLFTGASVIVSQRYGAHDDKGLHTAVHTTLSIALILCVLTTVAGMFSVRPMLQMMSTPEDVLGEATEYLRIYFMGISGLLLYNMGSALLRAVGDSRRPLYILCFSALTNVAGDLIFVLAFRMGVAGVAYATILSQFLSAALVLFLLTREKKAYGIRWNRLCLDKDTILGILNLGLPSGIQQAVTSFSNVFVQSYINFFGSSCMAGWSSYNKLDVFVLIPMQSIALASTTFVGQNVGAKQMKRAGQGVRTALNMSLLVTAALIALVEVFARDFIRLFTPEEDVIAYGAYFVRLISPFYLTTCFNQIFAGALRGVGDAKRPTVIMLASFVVFRQIFLYVAKLLGNSFLAISLAYPMGWIVCSVLLTVCYSRSKLGKRQLAAIWEG